MEITPLKDDIDYADRPDFTDDDLEYVTSGGPIVTADPIDFAVEFLTGQAGTGKTFELKRRNEEDGAYGIFTATTGIAAINLNAATINSVLKYFDTDSMQDSYTSGKLGRYIRELARSYRNIIIDEVSMMPGEQLDTLFMAVRDHNKNHPDMPFGIVCTGDFLQLPPVKAKWAFEAECWPYFANATNKLTKIWRQDDLKFLEALNCVRAGNGLKGAELLKEAGVTFVPGLDQEFNGTTIMAKNEEVDRFNSIRLTRLPGQPFGLKSHRWGDLGSEVKKNIPDMLVLKPGALVMILINEPGGELGYGNGDLGTVVKMPEEGERVVAIKLQRNDKVVNVPYITREKTSTSAFDRNGKALSIDDVPVYSQWITPEDSPNPDAKIKNPLDPPWGEVYYDPEVQKFVVGAVRYMPLRLGWASTVHKSQGLSLDNVQLDPRAGFFGAAGMAYVALSRARTPNGLRIVGHPTLFGARVKVDEKVKGWV